MLKAFFSVLSSIIIFISSYTGLFSSQVKTVQTITKVEDGFYLMDYQFDYNLPKMLENGVSSHVKLITDGLRNVFDTKLDFGCTTFNSITEGGDYLLSRNFDYMDAPYMLLWTHPSYGYESISSVSLAFLGYSESFLPEDVASSALTLLAPYTCLDGVNEKGLSIGVLELEKAPTFQLRAGKPSLTTTTMIRACLDTAATVDEAIALFNKYNIRDYLFGECTYHYHIADATGKSVVIEYVDGKISLIYPEENSENAVNYQCATNFYLTPGVDDPDGMGQDRYETAITALTASKGVTSEKEAMDILESCSMLDADLHGYICSTLWSCVYNCTDKTVNVVHYLDYENTYTFSVDKPLEY